MANFCNLKDFKENIDNYNVLVDDGMMDEELFNVYFPDLDEDQRTQLLEIAFNSETNTWNTLSEEMFQSTNPEEESPEPTGDSSMDLHNIIKYNSSTQDAHKMWISHLLKSNYILGQIKDEFRKTIFSRCIYDIDKHKSVNPKDISLEINRIKFELARTLNKLLDLGLDLKDDTSEWLNTSIHEVLDEASKRLDDVMIDEKTILEARKAFYKLAYFDDILSSFEIVTRDPAVSSYEHKLDMYKPKFGKDKVFAHTFSQNDMDLDMDDITTPFVKELFNVLPLVDKNGNNSKNLKVGWNGFQRAVTGLMAWIKTSGNTELYEKITDGDMVALGKALKEWLDSGISTGSIYNSSINEEVARSISKFLFPIKEEKNYKGETIYTLDTNNAFPEYIRNIIYTQIVKTSKRAYLSYDYDNMAKSMSLNVLEDKAIVSESSHLTNILIGRISQIKKDPSLKQRLFGEGNKAGIIRDLKITTTSSGASLITFQHNQTVFKFLASPVTTTENGEKKIISWSFNVESSLKGSTSNDSQNEKINNATFDLIYDLFGYNLGLPETKEDRVVLTQFLKEAFTAGRNKTKTLLDIFVDPICIALLASQQTAGEKAGISFNYYDDAKETINLKSYFKNYDDLAKFLYWCTGYDSKNVVKDLNGNKIPLYGLVSAIMQYPSLLYKARQATADQTTVYGAMAGNHPILNGQIRVGEPLIRSGIATSTGKKSASEMTEAEILINSAFVDYGQSILFDQNKKIDGYRAHRFMDGRTIFIQPTVFSDKSMQFVLPFTFIKQDKRQSHLFNALKYLAENAYTKYDAKKGVYTNDDKLKAQEAVLTQYVYDWQSKKYTRLLQNTFEKFKKVYSSDTSIQGLNFYNDDGKTINATTINYLDSFIKSKIQNIDLMRAKFEEANVELVPEIDYTKNGLNQGIKNAALNVFGSIEQTTAYFERQKRILIQDIVRNNINLYDNIIKIPGMPADWSEFGKIKLYKIYHINESGERVLMENANEFELLLDENSINPNYEIELNPILNSWFYADGICSQAWEEIFFGLNENNPNKSADAGDSSMSGRLLAQYKRTVSAGSTVHLYQQGRVDGVPKNFRCAVIDDANFAYATSAATGQVYAKDPHDGSALMNPFTAILTRNSLGTAADGVNQAKTILHDVDKWGNGILCKWATYSITNAMRRTSKGGKYDLEQIHKKMNNFKISINTVEIKAIFDKAKETYGDLYMYDNFLRHDVKINDIDLKRDENGEYFELTVQNCDEYGKTEGDTYSKIIRGNFEKVTLYDLNRAFGGATFKIQNKNHKLEYSELNNEIVVDYLIEKKKRGTDYTEQLISYLINGSAIKRGAKNVNSSSAFEDRTPFRTMMVSSKMGGLMMATEHDVDGTVHEMSQIMASLVQKGYTTKQARKIYSDIGKIVETTARNLFDGTQLTDEKRKEIIENYLVKSLNSSTGKGIGSADSIALYAKDTIRDKDGNIQRVMVPFSLADIRNKFLSVVNAYLSNEAIIREYPGLQGVNTPSRGMIQYYNVEGQSYGREAAERRVGEIITSNEVDELLKFFKEAPSEDPEYNKNLAVQYAFKPYNRIDRDSHIAQLVYTIFGIELKSKSEIFDYIGRYKEVSSWDFVKQVESLIKEREKNPDFFETSDGKKLWNNIKLLSEFIKTPSSEVITAIKPGQFLTKVSNFHDLKIGQTILVKSKGSVTYKKIILESGWQRDRWANLQQSTGYDIYRVELAPEDLKQPQISFSINSDNYNNTTTEADLDVVRAMFYFKELSNPKANPEFIEEKKALVMKVLEKIYSFGDKKYRFSRELYRLYGKHLKENFTFQNNPNAAEILFILRDYQQEIYRQFKLRKVLTANDEILGEQDAFRKNKNWALKFNQVDAGEIAISAAYAKELHLEEGDDLGEIQRKGSSFFADRINKNYDPSNYVDSEDWDLVLTNNLGEQVLVKINSNKKWSPVGENGESLFSETSEGVERQANSTFYNGAKICSNEDWDSKNIKIGRIAKSNQSASMKIIVLENIEDLRLFEDTNLFNTKETRYNFTDNNISTLWTSLRTKLKVKRNAYILPGNSEIEDGIKIPTNEKIAHGWTQSLRNWQRGRDNDYINRVAKRMYANFEDTLLYFGTRIPSQALQSGMALKVKMFVGANSNQVFIPGAMHWFEGADYDIDKTYMMRLGLINGKLDLLSDLYDDFGSKCAELPLPNKDSTHEISVTTEPGITITEGLQNNNGRFFYRGTHYVYESQIIDRSEKKNSQKMFDTIKKILEDTAANPTEGRNIVIVRNMNHPHLQEYVEYLKDALDIHNNTNMNNPRKTSIGLKNKNVLNARAILLDPETFLCSSDPVAFDTLSNYAQHSELGGREKTVSLWNGMTKAIMQAQFQLGKKEIGIIATAIKTFLMKTSVVNNAINTAADLISQGYYDQALDILSKYVYKVVDIYGTERLGILANVNFQPLYDALGSVERVNTDWDLPEKFDKYKGEGKTVNIKQLLDDLSNQDAEYDVLMALSSLLSAATDNAKELILSKINASQSTVDLFCSMLGSGYSLENILNTFSSRLFTIADALTKSNLYTGSDSSKTLAKAIDFVNYEGTLLSGKYEKRFFEFVCLPELLYDKNKFIADGQEIQYPQADGKITRISLQDFYETYIRPLKETDPNGIAKGDPKNDDIILRKSTKEKKIFFISRLLNLQTLRRLKPKLNELYAQVQERLDKSAGRIKKKGSGYEEEYPEWWDPETEVPDTETENTGEIQQMSEAMQAEMEAAAETLAELDPENEGHTGQKQKRSLNLTLQNLTLEDLNTFRDYISNVEYREKIFLTIDPNTRKEDALLLKNVKDKIIPVASENRILGMIAKINQGLVSNDEDLYNLFKSIEVYFNNEARSFYSEEWKELPGIKTFSLMDFISDGTIRNAWIKLFDKHKYETNVLRILAESDNFFNMFRIYKLSHETSRMQYITDLTWKLCDDIVNYIYDSDKAASFYKLSTEQYRIIKKTVSDALPFIFLKTLPESLRIFKYDKGSLVYPSKVANQLSKAGISWDYTHPLISEEAGQIDIGTTEGAATFKKWCETEILNTLKSQFSDNPFVRNLHIERKYNPRTRTWNSYLSLGIDMTNITKSIKLQSQFNEVQQAFLKIMNEPIKFGGEDSNQQVSLKSILYLYDLIQNKGGLGANSFGALFGETLNTDIMNPNSIIGQYWRFLNNLDTVTDTTSREQFEANFRTKLVDDVVWRLASDQKTRQLINANGEENRVVSLNDKSGKLYGYRINGKDIYLVDGDFTFNLPFTGDMEYNQAISMETKGKTHFFNQEVDENGNINYLDDATTGKVVTRTLIKNLFTKLPQVNVLENFDPKIFTEDEINTFRNWPVFALRGKMYVNLNCVTDETPARTLIPLMAMVARQYKDASGKKPWAEKWENLISSLRQSSEYDSLRKKTFEGGDPNANPNWYSEFAGQASDDFVLATYIQNELIKEDPFLSAESKITTDEDFADSISEIINYMFGLGNFAPEINKASFALSTIGEVLQNFGNVLNSKTTDPNQDFHTITSDNINIKRLIKAMMENSDLSIKDC